MTSTEHDYEALDPDLVRAAVSSWGVGDYTPETHPLAELPFEDRVLETLRILARMPIQDSVGLSQRALAEICGCSASALDLIENAAIRKLLAELERRGITSTELNS